MALKMKCWQRLTIVIGNLWASVVARMNAARGGGSSSVLSRAVEGFAREHVRFVDDEDLVAAFHRRVGDGLAQAAGVVDAAVGRAVDFHHVHVVAHRDAAGTGSHWLQGSPVGACTQFSALAKIRAMVVLPTPRVPLSR